MIKVRVEVVEELGGGSHHPAFGHRLVVIRCVKRSRALFTRSVGRSAGSRTIDASKWASRSAGVICSSSAAVVISDDVRMHANATSCRRASGVQIVVALADGYRPWTAVIRRTRPSIAYNASRAASTAASMRAVHPAMSSGGAISVKIR